MKKILFISGGETITKMFVGVIKKLEEPGYEVLVINRDHYYKENSSEILNREGIPTKSLQTYKTKDARKILRLEQASVVVVGHDNSAIERSFILGGRCLGIPSLLVQDGIINLPRHLSTRQSIFGLLHLLQILKTVFKPSLYLLFTCGTTQFLSVFLRLNRSHNYGRGECSKVAVMSPYAKNVFMNLGFSRNDVIITGQPRFDRLFNATFTKKEVYKKIGISYSKDILLLATPIFGHLEKGKQERKEFIRAAIRAIEPFDKLVLVIKLHPGADEDPRMYKEILEEEQFNNAIIVKDFDVPSLINACRIFISHHSTMALEAIIRKKPVIILNLFNDTEYYPFVASGVALGVYKAEDLLTAVESLLYNETVKRKLKACRDDFVYEHTYKSDGRASERVANLIKKMYKQSCQ